MQEERVDDVVEACRSLPASALQQAFSRHLFGRMKVLPEILIAPFEVEHT